MDISTPVANEADLPKAESVCSHDPQLKGWIKHCDGCVYGQICGSFCSKLPEVLQE